MKVALCCVIRLENLYLKEWIDYHKKLGFDNIIIYDNNKINEDKIDDVILEYIQSGFVIVDNTFFNYKYFSQPEIYKDCLTKYHIQYDWIGIWDLDEFLYLENDNNIHTFLNSNNNFNLCDTIVLQWLLYKDNGYLEVNSHSVLKNFDEITNCSINHHLSYFKSLINCKNIQKHNIKFNFGDAHRLSDNNLLMCDTLGNYIYGFNGYELPCLKSAYLKHFVTKSLSEYIDIKLKRGLNWEMMSKEDHFDLYKRVNDWSVEYDNYINYLKNPNNINNKKILVCIFNTNKYIYNILHKTYIQTINEFDNIEYKIINQENINFNNYYNIIKEIYENNNIYDYIVFTNQQTYINIYLLNRFLNIIADENTVYTNILQQYLTNYDINERFFIISKKHLELILNDDILKNEDSFNWYPSYTLGIIFNHYNIRIYSLGNINFYYDNILEIKENTVNTSIICWTNSKLVDNNIDIDKLQISYDTVHNFICENKSKFVLRLYPMYYGHMGKYVEYNNQQNPGYIYQFK